MVDDVAEFVGEHFGKQDLVAADRRVDVHLADAVDVGLEPSQYARPADHPLHARRRAEHGLGQLEEFGSRQTHHRPPDLGAVAHLRFEPRAGRVGLPTHLGDLIEQVVGEGGILVGIRDRLVVGLVLCFLGEQLLAFGVGELGLDLRVVPVGLRSRGLLG